MAGAGWAGLTRYFCPAPTLLRGERGRDRPYPSFTRNSFGMKLYVFGASGAGVSTLGAALAAILGATYFDGDAYFWEVSDPPFTVRRLARGAQRRPGPRPGASR
ncbi:MAG: hypothetical protein WKG07_36235 [Hymenobacter sp.]